MQTMADVLVPIVGVATGWILSELSGVLRAARESRQGIKTALPWMISVYFEQYRINEILTYYNRTLGDDFEGIYIHWHGQAEKIETVGVLFELLLEQYEHMRRDVIALKHWRNDGFSSDAQRVSEAVSGIDPVLGYRTRKLLSEFTLFQAIEMPSPKSDSLLYMKTLQSILTVYRSDMALLRNVILRVSFRASPICCLRTWFLLRSEEAELICAPHVVTDTTVRPAPMHE